MSRTTTLPRARAKPVRVRRLPLPSGRSVAVGLGLLALAGGLYAAARQTSVFAVTRIEVVGGPPAVRHAVKDSVAKLRGTSLLALDGSALDRVVTALPSVVSVGYDRSFPHTLRLEVVAERPVAVVRQGAKSWLVSARGRVIAAVPSQAASRLARIWIPHTTPVRIGGFLPANHAAAIARALALATHFPAHVATASLRRAGLVFRLRDGMEIRLGDPVDIRLKLAIARWALRRVPAGSAYVDVSVPGRPVAGPNSQVSGGG